MSTAEGTMRAGRATMAIGEVLAVLQPDFPDVTVSKIRFLESEGLIAPERTPSGYRKFSPKDLERLRFVLTLQRDSYLPLKVIRERLAAYDAGDTTPETIAPPALHVAPEPSAATAVPAPATPAPGSSAPIDDELTFAPDMKLTENDLADQAGIDLAAVRTLREFGVVCEHREDGIAYFDGEDLVVTRLARDMLKLGLDARHLKSLRRFADQETAMFEQLVAPALRNRRPEARQQAADTLAELVRLSHRLRSSYVRQALRDTLDG